VSSAYDQNTKNILLNFIAKSQPNLEVKNIYITNLIWLLISLASLGWGQTNLKKSFIR
jgi:hypothetical protein